MIAALVVVTATGWAHAQGAEPTPAELKEAAEAFDHGREAYKAERFAEAADQFELADSSAPSSTALGLALRSRDRAGDLDRAGTLAALALERYPDDPDIAKVAPDVLTRARSELYEITISCDEACELADGTKVVHGAAARQRTVFLTSGTHELRAGFADGRTVDKSVGAIPGTNGTLSFEAPPPEPEVAAPSEPEPVIASTTPEPTLDEEPKKPGGLSPVVFYVAAGATVVAVGVTVWSGLDTLKNPGQDRVRTECREGDVSCPTYKAGLAHQRRTNILIGVTAGLGVATGLIAALAVNWSGDSAPAQDAKLHPGPRVEPFMAFGDGATLGARGTF